MPTPEGVANTLKINQIAVSNYMYSDFEDCGFIYSKTKRVRHIYQYLYDPDNLLHCVYKSQQRKHRNRAVIKFNENFSENVDRLYWMLRNEEYVPGPLRKRHQMLGIMDAIVECNNEEKGLPIGRYTSQMFGNFYLTDYGHYALEVLHVHYVYVYMDNIVILGDNKERLHEVFTRSALFLATHDHLELNPSWQVFPIAKRDLDHVGFRISPHDVRLRKGILLRFFKKLDKTRKDHELHCENDIKHAYPSEYGWLTHCSPKHKEFLINKIISDNGKKHHQTA